MASRSPRRRLVACLLNVSEARRKEVVENVAKAALCNAEGIQREETTVLNIFNDPDYNRSVITIVASINSIRDAALSACQKACALIDMHTHAGVHPCMGAVDLVPFYPLGEELWLTDSQRQSAAPAPSCSAGLTPPYSEAWPRGGRRWAGVGASTYVMNCNVTIDTQDITTGRSIATAIRESTPGGLPGVQVLALPHEGAVELACNVESVKGDPPGHPMDEPWPSFIVDGQPYCHAPASLITARVAELARRRGIGVKGTALVGFTPRECKDLAEIALSQGIGEFWKEQRRIRM
ncbi:hypothetical protein XENOCAPTIV_009184 [Xenoophorus captivus]|uniref:Formiminotransferase N-terminal subdomain domain-containing protein n=1 Tax=Xenoophorus captivus TaxID=1517983 RepID=A0ABV0R0N1_9TELE